MSDNHTTINLRSRRASVLRFATKRKCFPMNNLLDYQRINAFLASSLILVTGCRSASVNSSSSANPIPSGNGSSQMYRPYSEDTYQPQAPQPMPPAVLPTPGYTDPATPDVPPPPSAQKSRWNFVPSNLKFPSLNRLPQKVDQTAANTDGQDPSTKKIKKAWGVKGAKNRDEEVIEEIVRPRQSVARFAPEQSKSAPAFTGTDEQPEIAAPADSDQEWTAPSETPTRPRLTTNNPLPVRNKWSRPANPVEETTSANSIPAPDAVGETIRPPGEPPLLLPPNP